MVDHLRKESGGLHQAMSVYCIDHCRLLHICITSLFYQVLLLRGKPSFLGMFLDVAKAIGDMFGEVVGAKAINAADVFGVGLQ